MALDRGFTLIEVLVALTILAVALSAALHAASIATDTASTFRERLLAGWVAENRLAVYASGLTPEIGVRAGTAEQAGVTFTWREQVSAGPAPHLRRIDVQVVQASVPDHVLARLVGYASAPRTR